MRNATITVVLLVHVYANAYASGTQVAFTCVLCSLNPSLGLYAHVHPHTPHPPHTHTVEAGRPSSGWDGGPGEAVDRGPQHGEQELI